MSAEPSMHELMMAASTSYRLQHSGITIDGTVALDFDLYPYIPMILDERSPQTTVLKGAQMGFTIAAVMRALEEAKSDDLRGIMYGFPTEGEVSDFAKARFGPMMTNNAASWGDFVKDTDSASLKRINDTFLYFRGIGQRGSGGSNKSTSKLKSIPIDSLYLDERDEMDDMRVDAVMHRLDGSLDPRVFVLSTPTLPGYGVDLDYKSSNQCVWLWQCQKCNEWNCLEMEYPECIAEPVNEDPYYICMKCREPLDRVKGDWVPLVPSVTDHAGFWVSQLASPTRSAADIVLAAEGAQISGRRREFENQVLARAYAEVEDEITREQLEELVDKLRPKPLRHAGPAAMGVDPGKRHHYEVRIRKSARDMEQVCRGVANSYEELSAIIRRYNVKSGVMDMGFDPTRVQAFCKDHPGWYGCLYVTSKKTEPDWDHRERVIKCGREWILDLAHSHILDKRVSMYAKDEKWGEYVAQMTNLKRAVTEDQKTGAKKAQWIVTGGAKNDHYRHAGAYVTLACMRAPLARETTDAYSPNNYGPRRPKRKSAMVI